MCHSAFAEAVIGSSIAPPPRRSSACWSPDRRPAGRWQPVFSSAYQPIYDLNDLTIVGEYTDFHSGWRKSDARPQFQQLMADLYAPEEGVGNADHS